MNLLYKIIYLIFFISFYTFYSFSSELVVTSNGKRTISETINIGLNKTKTLIKNDATFSDNYGNIGIITCLGTMENDSNNIEFNLKCEGINQKDERFWTKIYREKGGKDAGIGTLEYIGGEGFYKKLIGKKCNYAIRYFRKNIYFFKQNCKL